jgi:hypothetical protein
MRNESHKSLIGILREHVIAWRKSEGWSRETVVQVIIESDKSESGIVFNPQTSDAFEKMKVNADRVFRWLDDESKDTNLCPPNFIPAILKAMPQERRLMCSSEIMVSIGLGACLPTDGDEAAPTINDVFEVQRDDLEALQSVATAIQNPTAENLEIADRKLARAQKRKERLQKMIAGARKAAAAIGRVMHTKKVTA